MVKFCRVSDGRYRMICGGEIIPAMQESNKDVGWTSDIDSDAADVRGGFFKSLSSKYSR